MIRNLTPNQMSSDLMDTTEKNFPPPPVSDQYSELPYKGPHMPWPRFEKLCFKYLCSKYGANRVSQYGNPGQKQSGIDFYVYNPETGRHIVFQCKHENPFDKGKLQKAIREWEDGKWFGTTEKFVLFSTNNLIETSFVDHFVPEKARLAEIGIVLEKMGNLQIDAELKEQPALVEEFFGNQWRDKFCTSASLRKYLDHPPDFIPVPKNEYGEVPYYIERKLTNPNQKEQVYKGIFQDQRVRLFDHIEKCYEEARIVRIMIKAEAAVGKSKELENLAFRYSDPQKELYPVLVRFKNFHGEIEPYITAFYRDWKKIPAGRLLLLLDGLDEIPAVQFNDFVKKFNIFIQFNCRINIIASIRTNVFTHQMGSGIDESNRLKNFYLNHFSDEDIELYIAGRLTDTGDQRKFRQFAKKKWVSEILNNPFYLCGLIDLYQKDPSQLPQNKTDVIIRIIQDKIDQDRAKFGEELHVKAVLDLADKLACYLTLTGRNAIQESELGQFTGLLNIADIRRCSLFKIGSQGSDELIYFEHNNFQEYLTAAKLSRLSWAQLEPVICHTQGTPMIKPKMINTVNFLFTILAFESDTFQTLFKKLKETDAPLILQFEKDKLSNLVRFNIFKEIILTGKAERIYYLGDDYKLSDLLDFVNHSGEAFSFILDELASAAEINHMHALLDMIFHYDLVKVIVPLRRRLRDLICKLLLTKGYEYAIYDIAIDILTRYSLFERGLLKKYIKSCPMIGHKMVRSSAIKYIDEAGFDEEFRYVIESNEVLMDNNQNISAGVDFLYLRYILNHLDQGNAVILLNYFAKHVDSLEEIASCSGFSESDRLINKIYLKLGALSQSEPAIYEAYIGFLIALDFDPSYMQKYWANPELFFNAFPDKARIFWDLLNRQEPSKLNYLIGFLYTGEQLADIIRKYRDGELSENDLVYIRSCVGMINNQLYDDFQQELLNNFGNTFAFPERIDWKTIQKSRKDRDMALLQDRSLFLEEAEKIYQLIKEFKGQQADGELTFELENSEKRQIRDRVNNTVILRVIDQYQIKGGFAEFVKCFTPEGWQWYIFQMVEEYLVNTSGDRPVLPEKLIRSAEQFLTDKIVPNINFRKAIKENKDQRYKVYYHSERLVHYYKYGNTKLPENIQLDMLLLDYSGYGIGHHVREEAPKTLYSIIYERVDPVKFKRSVLANMHDHTLSARVRATHAQICKEYHYEDGVPCMLFYLEDQKFQSWLKPYLIDDINALTDDPGVYEGVLTGIKVIRQEWQLKVCQYLSHFPEYQERIRIIVERSPLEPFVQKTQFYWKHELILLGVRLGSKKSVSRLFWLFKDKKVVSDYITIKAGDFEKVVAGNRDWLLTETFKLFWVCAPYISGIRHNELHSLLEELVSLCAVKTQQHFQWALNEYERIIEKLAPEYPKISYFKWFEKRLIKRFYLVNTAYESEQDTWTLIRLILSS